MVLRTITGALFGAVVMIGVVATFIAPPDTYPQVWVPVGLGVLAVAVFALCETVGYAAPAVVPGTDRPTATAQGVAAYRTSFFVRLALCESVALVAFALMFVALPSTAWSYYIGAVLALGLLAVHTWPGERTIRRTQDRLERNGGQSYLREALTGTPGGGATSPVREG